MKHYCQYESIQCEYCNEFGQCQITACTKKGTETIFIKSDPMNYRIVQLVELTDGCIERIADAVARKIKNECNS